MKGYKAFDENLQCRGFQFTIGETFKVDGELLIHNSGFHFCAQLKDVYSFYDRSYNTRICEVEALGDIQTEETKSCTNILRIVRELSKDEIKSLTDDLKLNSGNSNSGDSNSGDSNSGDSNSGDSNSGNRNSGHYNSGNRNSGNHNSGHYNSGNYNSGNRNSGNSNSGDSNSGDSNSGNRNSGHYNSGHYNSGNYNSGNRNSGFFNTKTPKVCLFNKVTNINFDDKRIRKLECLNVIPVLQWVYESSMTDEEKKNYPSYKTTGGFLKNTGKQDWSQLTDSDKELILSLPGYDDEVFKEITGISLLTQKKNKQETVE